jgi:hypothetical protein
MIELLIVCSDFVQSPVSMLGVDFKLFLLFISSAFLPYSERYHSPK